jgi:hypothetical protein
LHGAVGEFDLKPEAGGLQLGETQALEDFAPEALEASGDVPHRQAQDSSRVPGAAAAEDPAAEAPVGHGAAGHVSRPKDQVRVGGGRDQGGDAFGSVGEVGVHLHHELRSLGQRPLEARDVRSPETVLRGAVEHVHRLELGSQAIGDVTSAVR